MGRSYKTEAVVLRSIRYAEADRVLHLYTLERGRVNAIAKGVRKTGSRFGARLEPLTHSALMLHEGRGELHTVSGADIVSSQEQVRADGTRWRSGLIGAEAVLKLFVEPEPNPACVRRAVPVPGPALTGRSGARRSPARRARPGLPAEAAGAVGLPAAPGLVRVVRVGRPAGRVLADRRRGGLHGLPGGERRLPAGGRGVAAVEGLLERPLAPAALAPDAAAGALRMVEETYAQHGGFRLRTLQPS